MLVLTGRARSAEGVRDGLRAAGLRVESVPAHPNGEARALAERFHAIVLDLSGPAARGDRLLRSLRASKPRIPVIALLPADGADRGIAALDAGAADYMVMPLATQELAARVRAQLRRASRAWPGTLVAGDIEVDLLSRETWRAGIPIELSATELALLHHLILRCGEVCSRDELLAAAWGARGSAGHRTVDQYVGYLRRKLAVGGRQVPLHTVTSHGYRLADPGALSSGARQPRIGPDADGIWGLGRGEAGS